MVKELKIYCVSELSVYQKFTYQYNLPIEINAWYMPILMSVSAAATLDPV